MSEINEQVFGFLEGEWSVRRQFEGSCLGVFSGEACFTPEAGKPPTYRYSEQGELTDSEGKTFDAKQCYRYRLAGGKFQMLKREESDWMVMHDLEFRYDREIAIASHVHLCGQDHYAATYRIDLSGGWEVDYIVSGPKKDYCIHSVYTRNE